VDRHAEHGPHEHQRAGGDADLTFQRDRLLAAHHGQARFGPSRGAAFDVDDLAAAGRHELFTCLSAATARTANDIQRLAGPILAGLEEAGRVEHVQGHVARQVGVDFAELDRRANVDQLDRLAASPPCVQIARRNREHIHR
jgi:hypothetical protein